MRVGEAKGEGGEERQKKVAQQQYKSCSPRFILSLYRAQESKLMIYNVGVL